MVTSDKRLEYQQNLKRRKLALVVLSTNHIIVPEQHPQKLLSAIESVQAGSYEFVRYTLPPKPKRTG